MPRGKCPGNAAAGKPREKSLLAAIFPAAGPHP